MRKWIAAWAVAGIIGVTAQEVAPDAADAEVPPAEAAIPPPVKALEAPAERAFPNSIQMAVTAANQAAQTHVLQGLNHLHGGWEIEASRHFAAALRADPECLLAHWGMIISLLSPSPEIGPARNAASDRLLELVDAGKGTGLERGYAYGLIKYMEDGPAGAATAFQKVAEEYPNDIQAAIFAALFGRSGYNEFGDATPDQARAEKNLEELVAKHPENPVPLNALLVIRAEAPDLSNWLPLARKLNQLLPDYPPYLHLLGHYEWRSGQHGRAVTAFQQAADLYQTWMKANDAGVADCPGWVIAECYRIVALASSGEEDAAYAAALNLAAIPIPAERGASPGARALMWEAKTLPARLLLRRGLPDKTAEALKSLPEPKELKPFHDRSLAYWWVDGLRFVLEAKRLMEAGELVKAREAMNAIGSHGQQMVRTQQAAAALGEQAAWNRAFRGLEVLASEIEGRYALAGPKAGHGSAFNWFRSGTDRQRPSTMLYPPAVLTPMASRLGDYYLAVNRPAEAVEAYEEALEHFPNDLDALNGMQRAAELAELPAKAAEAAAKLKALENP